MTSARLRPAPALARVGVSAALLAVAAGAWVFTVARMDGMDMGPGGALGSLGWFAVTWLAMMAAMMLPVLVPAAAARSSAASFAVGYLAAWTAAGVVAYVVVDAVRALDLGFLAWDQGGRWVAAGVLLAAAVYQLTPAKAHCLDRCRTPQPTVGGLWYGASCIACCAGLVAALFALGWMSLTWMVVVAALIAAERLLPWRTPAVYAVAAVLAVLGLWLAIDRGSLPGLTVPGAM
jgi:predicted metal-binding membrane protein